MPNRIKMKSKSRNRTCFKMIQTQMTQQKTIIMKMISLKTKLKLVKTMKIRISNSRIFQKLMIMKQSMSKGTTPTSQKTTKQFTMMRKFLKITRIMSQKMRKRTKTTLKNQKLAIRTMNSMTKTTKMIKILKNCRTKLMKLIIRIKMKKQKRINKKKQ